MERLKKVGQVKSKKSADIEKSKIGLGFEKLDRDIFEPEKAYPYLAESGVKYARLQSGWQRTEKEKGVYDFAWLDEIVDNIIAMGIEPWLCLCYGNQLYTELAKVRYGAVGCPPIDTEEERVAWNNYVKATVKHFHGRIQYYEIWNEPDSRFSWRGKPNATELGEFSVRTARACKEADPDCTVVGFVLSRPRTQEYRDELCATGICDEIDILSYHCYSVEENQYIEQFKLYDDIRLKYNPKLKVVQGESGAQSRSDGAGALAGGAWTPLKQCKFLLRHLIIDIACGSEMVFYFTCVDMIEALHGTVGDLHSYLDYGYFGVLGADFDEQGKSTGEYTPKPSFTTLQTLTSIFCNDYSVAELPIEGMIEPSVRLQGEDFDFEKARHFGFSKPNGSYAIAYWVDKNILTETYEGTVSVRIRKGEMPNDMHLVDMLTGDIFDLPEGMIVDDGEYIKLVNMPILDSPLLLTFGEFCI